MEQPLGAPIFSDPMKYIYIGKSIA